MDLRFLKCNYAKSAHIVAIICPGAEDGKVRLI